MFNESVKVCSGIRLNAQQVLHVSVGEPDYEGSLADLITVAERSSGSDIRAQSNFQSTGIGLESELGWLGCSFNEGNQLGDRAGQVIPLQQVKLRRSMVISNDRSIGGLAHVVVELPIAHSCGLATKENRGTDGPCPST